MKEKLIERVIYTDLTEHDCFDGLGQDCSFPIAETLWLLQLCI